MKLQIGGSPCTYWSIAQTKNREIEPKGLGWDLFENYLIAMAKFQPDYFLYENNKSMSAAIRAEITKRFGFEPVCINSALVSAQNRQRLYWVGKREPDGTYSQVPVEQPEDRGILLRDILETGVAWREKGYTLKANYYNASVVNAVDGGHFPAPMAAEPVNTTADGKAQCLRATYYKDGKTFPVYEVQNGLITVKDKQYPIKLADDFYIIRKLTVTECKRLQTVPDSYVFPVSDTQAYKMLGNGWTVDVIVHILSYCDGVTTEPLDVLSMYDGMACGHIALDKLGASIDRYRATEIDKYAIKTACHNFPNIEQLGDAFQVREWGDMG